jgi:hypothetical protein
MILRFGHVPRQPEIRHVGGCCSRGAGTREHRSQGARAEYGDSA